MIRGNHPRYLVLLLWYPNTPPYRHCTPIKLWDRVALFFVVCEHDLTMDALLENGLTDIRCCYHSNIHQENIIHTLLY